MVDLLRCGSIGQNKEGSSVHSTKPGWTGHHGKSFVFAEEENHEEVLLTKFEQILYVSK